MRILLSSRLSIGVPSRGANDYLSAMCEAVAGAMDADGTTILADISSQVTAKVACEESTIESYVSTESLLPDKGGRQTASALPATGKVTVYQPGDTLVSNIRPYFKKVWFADREGTCSGDVIVFRAKDPELAPYLYSILRSDGFFEHVMAGAKGTKMPRGDKKQMMQYPVANDCDEDDLEVLASMLDHISANNRESTRLSELRDALLPKLMAGEIDVSGIELSTQPNNHLSHLMTDTNRIAPSPPTKGKNDGDNNQQHPHADAANSQLRPAQAPRRSAAVFTRTISEQDRWWNEPPCAVPNRQRG